MEIKDRYFGSSQKALLVALKDAQKNIIKSLLCLHIHRQNPAVRIFLWLDFYTCTFYMESMHKRRSFDPKVKN